VTFGKFASFLSTTTPKLQPGFGQKRAFGSIRNLTAKIIREREKEKRREKKEEKSKRENIVSIENEKKREGGRERERERMRWMDTQEAHLLIMSEVAFIVQQHRDERGLQNCGAIHCRTPHLKRERETERERERERGERESEKGEK
jgi:hypothetical protein